MNVQDIHAATLACDYILMTQNGALPIDPFKTIQKKGWDLDSYSYLHSNNIISMQTLQNISNEAFTLYTPIKNSYTIAFNDSLPINTIRFALAHEIGHIVLKHFTNKTAIVLQFDENHLRLNRNQVPIIERAADIFAANFLLPAPLLESCNLNCNEISQLFDVSELSAQYIKYHAKTDSKYVDIKTKQQLQQRFKNELYPYYFSPYNTEF